MYRQMWNMRILVKCRQRAMEALVSGRLHSQLASVREERADTGAGGEGVRGFDFEGLNLTFCPFPVLEHWGRVLDYRHASCMKESILSQHYTRSLVGVNLWVVQWFVHTEEGGVPPRDL